MDQEQIIHMDEINIRTILKDLVWNLPFIILAVCIVLMGTRIYKNIVYVPEYTSNTTLAVMAKGSSDGDAYSSLSTASSMAEVFTEVFQSDIMKEKVEEAVGQFPEGTKITPKLIEETNLLELSVTAKDPKTAYLVLQAVLDNYKYVSDYLFGNAVLEVVMDPQVPMAPSNAFQTSRMDQLGILAALIIMCGIFIACSVFRRTVKTEKAARRNLEGKHIVTLPFEEKNRTFQSKIHKTNKALVLGSKVLNFNYEERCHQLADSVERMMRKDRCKTLLVTSVAENEGKSTVSVNLAAALAKRNRRVLLVDMDFKKPALHKLTEKEIRHQEDVKKLMQEKGSVKKLMQFDKKQNIYLILNDQSIDDCQQFIDPEVLKSWLKEAEELFDFIIIDSAPISAGTDTEYLKDFVQSSILVVRQDEVMTADINDTIEMLKDGRSKFLGYVLNAFDVFNKATIGKYDKYNKDTRGV